jgi:hypothetical protein
VEKACDLACSVTEARSAEQVPQQVDRRELMAAGPVSRILSALRRDGHSSGPRITAGLKRPTRRFGAPSQHASRRFRRSSLSLSEPTEPAGTSSLFGLAPCGVCPARHITAAAVRSSRTFSPLPRPFTRIRLAADGSLRMSGAVYFLWHFPSTGLEPGLPDVIRHTALRSSDFPLSSSTDHSDRPAQLPTFSLY